MKKYTVTFHPDAEQDVLTSYEWGCRAWGEKQAQQWVRELHHAIKKRLSAFPESCPLAPESEELGVLVRQFVMQRYRVLFIVKGKQVVVLHVRGAYAEGEDDAE